MSVRQMTAIWERAKTDDPTTLLVMLALADWANDEGICWPSIPSIAEKCRISERQAQRIVKSMEEVGALVVVRKVGRNNSNTYQLKVTDSHLLHAEKVTFEAKEKVTPATEMVTSETEKVTPTTQKVTPMSPEPSEPPKKPSRTTKAQAPFVLPDWVPKENWEGFEEMRKRIRKPMTNRAREMIVTELIALQNRGHPVGEVLDQSTRKCWQDVYELRNGHAAKSKLQEELDVIDNYKFRD